MTDADIAILRHEMRQRFAAYEAAVKAHDAAKESAELATAQWHAARDKYERTVAEKQQEKPQ